HCGVEFRVSHIERHVHRAAPIDRRVDPCRMDYTKILALERKRQRPKEFENRPALLLGDRDALAEFRIRGDAVKPVIPVLVLAPEDVELVVAGDCLRTPGFDELLYEPDRTGAVRAAIAEVTDKYQPASGRMATPLIVAEPLEQCLKSISL